MLRSWPVLGGVLLSTCAFQEEPGTRRPNFVLILADDLGWKDVSYNGSAYPTPNIDALAARGIVFTQGYATSPSCSPTRASLLTGRHPARFGITRAIRNVDYRRAEKQAAEQAEAAEEGLTYLPDEERTFAELLTQAGYETAYVGKWHLGLAPHLPDKNGFAWCRSVGSYSASPYFPPFEVQDLGHEERPDEYLTDHLTEQALEFLRQPHDRPFFLFLAHFAVHGPWKARADLAAHYEKTLDPSSDQGHAVYAAMIHSLDESVGRVVATLQELGLSESTVVIFTSDNGPTLEKSALSSGLDFENDEEGTSDASVRFTTTAPLRGGKLQLYEGGIRVPWIACWPGVISAGGRCDVPVVSLDLHPTILGLAGIEPEPSIELDGRDLGALLHGGNTLERDALAFYAPQRYPACAIRKGDRKLIHFYEGRTELYDLRADPGESNDLARVEPERAAQLLQELSDWLASIGARIPPVEEGRE